MACTYQCWRGPAFVTISVVLVLIAITTALRSASQDDAATPTRSIPHHISLNASIALKKSGFNIMANYLLISPEIFFSSPNSTIFAIRDSALANASLPPLPLKHLLQYHISPLRLSMENLLKKPQGSCFSTLLPGKNVVLTNVDKKNRMVEINHVFLSHPDVFLDEHIAIHGVSVPFSSLGVQDFYQGRDSIQAPICDTNHSLVSEAMDTKNMVEWSRIILLLSSNGYVSFSIGLNSVLDGVLEEYRNLSSVTIFAPPDFAFVASPSPSLDRIVRLHTLPKRITYLELASLPDKALLGTLLPDQDLQITGGGTHLTQGLAINGVEIVAPEMFSSKKFVVHAISRPFKIVEPRQPLKKETNGL